MYGRHKILYYDNFYKEIKTEIDNNKPVIIRMGYDKGGNHFVVVYGYEKGCNSDRDILLLDSTNCFTVTREDVTHPGTGGIMKITDSPKGRRTTLKNGLMFFTVMR